MPIHKIVDVVAMGHSLVTAARPVHMTCLMPAARMIRCAAIWIDIAHFNLVFLDRPVGILVVQMTIVEEIGMSIVIHRRVTAILAVLVIVVGMSFGHFPGIPA